MAKAKCRRCGGTATGDTFQDASKKINHAAGLTRGKPCGISYGAVIEIIEQVITPKSKPDHTDVITNVETTKETIIETIIETKPKKSKSKKE